MPYSPDPFRVALRRKRQQPYPALNVANGLRVDTNPGPQVASETPADDVKAAWQPTIPGQLVPIQGERVYDELYFDE